MGVSMKKLWENMWDKCGIIVGKFKYNYNNKKYLKISKYFTKDLLSVLRRIFIKITGINGSFPCFPHSLIILIY